MLSYIVRNTLQCYERCSGQLINPSKCSILFGAATDKEARDCVMSTLQVSSIAMEDKYLALPMPHGRMTKEKYKSTKQKLIKRFLNWIECHMSLGIKEVLIKSIAQAILTYVMGVFKLPATLCEEMEQLI
jgi:hypothetical protein